MRREGDISIVAWSAEMDRGSLAGELRALLDEGAGVRGVLVDMSGIASVRADSLEALTEAFTVCRDRDCRIGMYGLGDRVARLVEIMGLGADLPPVLGAREPEALASLRGNGQAPADAPEPVLEFDIDLSTAPTTKFDSAILGEPRGPADAGEPFEAQVGGPQADRDLLAVHWGDLAAMDYAIGGADADQIVAQLARSAETPLRPTVAMPPPADPLDEGVIDLGDTVPARRPFQTELLPAFRDDDDDDDGATIDLGDTAELFGGSGDEPSDFSPLDSGDDGPPGFMRAQQEEAFAAAEAPRTTAPDPLPPPTPNPPVARQPELAASGRAAQAHGAARSPVAAGAETGDGDETIMFQPGALDAALLAADSEPEPATGAPADPGAEGPALQARVPSAESRPAQPSAAAAAPGGPGEAPRETAAATEAATAEAQDGDEDTDSTVMFQPGALDAALLAEIAQSAGPETPPAAPTLAPPDPTPEPAPAATSNAARPANEAEVEIHRFLGDYALSTQLHVQALERFTQLDDEVLGPSDVHAAVGGSRGAVVEIVDQLVQARLVRRTRSPRVRGGSGFLYSPSPRVRRSVQRLIAMWQAPDGRAKIASWLEA